MNQLRNKVRFRYNMILRYIYLKLNKKKLINKQLFIVSNNCWGGIVYQDMGLPYLSPFVNMYMFIPCYLKLIKNILWYLDQELKFSEISIYASANEKRKNHQYPIGILGDVEIHFIHYTDKEYTLKKWIERVQRLDTSNLLFVMSERDGCTPELVKEFDHIDHQNKVCFANKQYGLKSTIYLKSFSDLPEVPGADEIMGHTYWKLPLVKFLNKGRQMPIIKYSQQRLS